VPRRLSGRTVAALSYDGAEPVLALPFTVPAAAAPAGAERPPATQVTWPPHDRVEWPAVTRSVRTAVAHPTAPLLVAALIGLFLLVQHLIDRNDPKLAGGLRNEPADLRFGAPVRGRTSL
jgi:hypothetical protein